MPISDEKPPQDADYALSEYLFRQFNLAKREDEAKDQVSRYTRIPEKLSVGKLYYFLNAIAGDPVITTEGLYIFKSIGWTFLG